MDEALKLIQLGPPENLTEQKREAILKSFIPKYSCKDIERWEKDLEKILVYSEKIGLFKTFASIERELSELEPKVIDAANQIDSSIQMQVDLARGK